MDPKSRHATPLHVTIVSDNPETLDGLESYLRRAGLTTSGRKSVEKLADTVPVAPSAVVLFPDDFQTDKVLSALAGLRSKRPRSLCVLVTKEPQRFESLSSADRLAAPLIVPKPVWGWAILEAIRSRLQPDAVEGEKSK
jgi:DNA-binding NtrC family response regulator